MGSAYSIWKNPDTTPMGDAEPTFDPLLGFPNGRKERGKKHIPHNLEIVVFF